MECRAEETLEVRLFRSLRDLVPPNPPPEECNGYDHERPGATDRDGPAGSPTGRGRTHRRRRYRPRAPCGGLPVRGASLAPPAVPGFRSGAATVRFVCHLAKDLTRDPRDANAGVSDLETMGFEAFESTVRESESSEPGDGRR